MNIGFVVAMSVEYIPFLKRLGTFCESLFLAGMEFSRYELNGDNIYLAKCGIGEVASSTATALCIGHFGCKYIVNFGLVGSLVPGKEGTLLAVRDVVHYDSDLTAFGTPLGAAADFSIPFIPADTRMLDLLSDDGLPAMRLASGDKFISNPSVGDSLRSAFGAHVCDMEGAGIALVCARSQVHFTMIKLVSDGADGDATADFEKNKMRSFGRAFDVVMRVISFASIC